MKIGFTGTRKGMTPEQRAAFEYQLCSLRLDPEGKFLLTDFHYGGCVGADAEAAATVNRERVFIVVHPGPYGEVNGPFSESRKPLPFLKRNKNIVDVCDELVAVPRTSEEELRSGTWATIRYARKKGKPITIIWPDGSTKKEPGLSRPPTLFTASRT